MQGTPGCVRPCPPGGPEAGRRRWPVGTPTDLVLPQPRWALSPALSRALLRGRRRAGPSRGWAAGGARRLLLAGPELVSERSRGWRRRWESGSRWEQSGGRAVRPGPGPVPVPPATGRPGSSAAPAPPGRRSPLRVAGPAPAAPMRFGSKMMPVSPGPRRAESRSGAAGGKMDPAGVEKGVGGDREATLLPSGIPSFPRSARAPRGLPLPLLGFPFLPLSRRDQLVRRARWSRARAGGAAGPRQRRGVEGGPGLFLHPIPGA